MRRRISGPGGGGGPRFTRADVAVVRAAASLAASVEGRRRAGHLGGPLGELAERLEALLRALDAAA